MTADFRDNLIIDRDDPVFVSMRASKVKQLKGDRAGICSLRVNEQYRITFRFEGGYADNVTCEDYH